MKEINSLNVCGIEQHEIQVNSRLHTKQKRQYHIREGDEQLIPGIN